MQFSSGNIKIWQNIEACCNCDPFLQVWPQYTSSCTICYHSCWTRLLAAATTGWSLASTDTLHWLLGYGGHTAVRTTRRDMSSGWPGDTLLLRCYPSAELSSKLFLIHTLTHLAYKQQAYLLAPLHYSTVMSQNFALHTYLILVKKSYQMTHDILHTW